MTKDKDMLKNMFGLYGIINIKIKRFKDQHKNKEDMYRKDFDKFFFYDYLEDLKRYNTFFNNIFGYIIFLLLFFIILWYEQFNLKIIPIIYFLFILFKNVEYIIYLKKLDSRIENVYENGYFITGFGVKEDTYCNIEHISLNIEKLHLELIEELERNFNYIIMDNTTYNFKNLQKTKKKRWKH